MCYMNQKFTTETIAKLGHYVYRLVDPRTGLTFYIGEGHGNRVFDHAAGVLKFKATGDSNKEHEDSVTAKMQQIRDIHAANLEVITIIHRHGMDQKTAFEVEGALIDAYPGLTNIQNGHGNSEYGCASTLQIQQRYQAEEAQIPSGQFMIIKVKEATIDDQGSLYEAVRKHWHVNLQKAAGRKVLACVAGLIRGVFSVSEWRTSEGQEGRKHFIGTEMTDESAQHFIGKRLPQRFCKRGTASPVLYP